MHSTSTASENLFSLVVKPVGVRCRLTSPLVFLYHLPSILNGSLITNCSSNSLKTPPRRTTIIFLQPVTWCKFSFESWFEEFGKYLCFSSCCVLSFFVIYWTCTQHSTIFQLVLQTTSETVMPLWPNSLKSSRSGLKFGKVGLALGQPWGSHHLLEEKQRLRFWVWYTRPDCEFRSISVILLWQTWKCISKCWWWTLLSLNPSKGDGQVST